MLFLVSSLLFPMLCTDPLLVLLLIPVAIHVIPVKV